MLKYVADVPGLGDGDAIILGRVRTICFGTANRRKSEDQSL